MRNLLVGAAMTVMAAGAAIAHHAGETFPVGDLMVSHAWTYETAAAGHATKVYLTIMNNGAEANRLIDARVDFAPQTVLQAQAQAQAQAMGTDGTLAVQDVAALTIEPGQSLTL